MPWHERRIGLPSPVCRCPGTRDGSACPLRCADALARETDRPALCGHRVVAALSLGWSPGHLPRAPTLKVGFVCGSTRRMEKRSRMCKPF
eukprot:gene8844-biopygen3164